MNTSEWISRSVSKLLPSVKSGKKTPVTPGDTAKTAIKSGAESGFQNTASGLASAQPRRQSRSTRERLVATLRHDEEALSPRVLRRTLTELRAVVDASVSEVEGGRRASALARWYASAPLEQRRDCWWLMSEQFSTDPKVVQEAHARYAAALGTPDEAAAEVQYRLATASPRKRLLQRFSAFPEGIRFLVDLRADMQPLLRSDKRLQALDAEMEDMFSTWFDVGFLELRRISWDSPASLIEKLIKYEAVHDIKSWADVKNRLDSDRRCYGFFHPRLPDDPLIFVEVALLHEIATGITPLLDEAAAVEDLRKATTAIFYSISNTQAGLRGVSFGDSLIKRVVETLKSEFPQLKVFCTLSPIPGFRAWLGKNAATMLEALERKLRLELQGTLEGEELGAAHLLAAADRAPELDEQSPWRRVLLRCCAHYLCRELTQGKPLDPVTRFHLGNGARIERLNWGGDPSAKGLKQSCGIMVNYLYDLKRLDKHRAMLAKGQVAAAAAVEDLLD